MLRMPEVACSIRQAIPHRQMNDQELKKPAFSLDLIRFSVGIENIEDIIADLSQALEQV